MAHKLNIKVIAEGVEIKRQQELLKDAGCDYGQGYVFSRPVSAADLESILEADPLDPKIPNASIASSNFRQHPERPL